MGHKKQYAPTLFSLLLMVVGIMGVLAAIIRERKTPEQLPSPTPNNQTEEAFEDRGNTHIVDASDAHEGYNSIPPTSGPHVGSAIAPWGVHDKQIPDELQVHNLEDGGVIIHYDPVRVDGDTIEKLRAVTNKYASQVILEPYTKPALPSPIVLTAWTRRLLLDALDEKRIEAFIQAYRGIDHHVSGE